MKIRVRAPATTANLGPGFDCAAVALDLWNELEVSRGDGNVDREHLGVRAFALLAPAEGWRFCWTDRIPQERGLGSSAAVIALGLLAAATVKGHEPAPQELLAAGLELEDHADNLAAALAGGVCLTWENRIARIADKPPALPIVLVPSETVSTVSARASLPANVLHADAAFTAARAALLGAALASGSSELFAAALADRLHEPHRAATARLLTAVRERLPKGALGASLSGSGPAVVVWTSEQAATACTRELERTFPEAQVLPLPGSPLGAHVVRV
jgi:homoserine kinase